MVLLLLHFACVIIVELSRQYESREMNQSRHVGAEGSSDLLRKRLEETSPILALVYGFLWVYALYIATGVDKIATIAALVIATLATATYLMVRRFRR